MFNNCSVRILHGKPPPSLSMSHPLISQLYFLLSNIVHNLNLKLSETTSLKRATKWLRTWTHHRILLNWDTFQISLISLLPFTNFRHHWSTFSYVNYWSNNYQWSNFISRVSNWKLDIRVIVKHQFRPFF